MNFSIRTQVLIGLATLVCIVLAGAAVYFVSNIGPGALAKLPAERTLAVTVGLTDTQRDQLATFLPDIQRIPASSSQFPVAALIKQPTGGAIWVLFDEHGNPQGGIAALGEKERTLIDDPSFRGFQSTYTPGTAWTYLRFPALASEFPGLSMQQPLAISFGTGSTQISWQNTSVLPSLATAQEVRGDDLVFSVYAGNLGMLIGKASSLLKDTPRIAAEAQARGWVAKNASNEVSMTYEILPLLNGPSGITVASASGQYTVMLTSESAKGMEETVAHLHRGVASQSASTSRLTETFDEKFTIDTLVDASSTNTTEETRGNWHIARTPSPNKQGLFSAFTSQRVILSTSDALLERMLSASSILGNPSLIARGTANIAALTSWVNSFNLGMYMPLQIFPQGKQTIQWSMTRKGGILTLELE